MTAQPYRPASDRGASPSADPDIIVVPEDAVEGDVVEGDVVEPEAVADYGVANDSAANDSAADDLTDSSREQDSLSNDYPAATEPSPTSDSASDYDLAATEPSLVTAGRQAADLGQQWHDIQAMFVDDPRGSVELAVTAADAAVSALADSLRQQQAALTQADADTEQLREALRTYRVFCQSLADLGGQLRQPHAVGR